MPKVEIEYCTGWGYLPKAVGLAEAILKEKKQDISQYVIVPSDGGRFEVTVNGELIFSKLKEGRFPESAEIQARL